VVQRRRRWQSFAPRLEGRAVGMRPWEDTAGNEATGTVISPDICSNWMTSSASVQPRCRQSSTARQTSRKSLAWSRLPVHRPVAFQYSDVPVLRIRTCIIPRCLPLHSKVRAQRGSLQSSKNPPSRRVLAGDAPGLYPVPFITRTSAQGQRGCSQRQNKLHPRQLRSVSARPRPLASDCPSGRR
jgi:hypothetical protein